MKRFRIRAALGSALALVACTTGCNLFGPFDTPQDARSKEAIALNLANQGFCREAADLLVTISNPSNDALIQLGWAYLCMAGATAPVMADTVYSFTTDTNQFTLVGALARKLVPMGGEKVTALQNAMASFLLITDDRVNVELGIAYLVKAASILAAQATTMANTLSLDRDDITGAACEAYAANCAAAVAGDCTAGMSDADVSTFSNFMGMATDRLSLAGIANLTALSNIIKAGVTAGAEFGRCFIRAKVIPSP